MTKVEQIERAVSALGAEELARFRAWFEQFDAAQFDRRIEADIRSGKLDRLADQALGDFREGRAKPI